MELIIQIINNNELDESELSEVKTYIKTKLKQISFDEDKKTLIPKIFHELVTSFTFDSNYDKKIMLVLIIIIKYLVMELWNWEKI